MGKILMKEYLKKLTCDLDIQMTEYQLQQFALFYDHLLKINKVMNLTAITEEKDVVIKHFIDSISIMKYFTFSDSMSVIDVGTGAGFPGIPLAIMFPQVNFTLVDSLNKRIHFLDDVIKICDLLNVETIHSRVEDLGHNEKYREKYDVCVSRAVANLSTLLEYCSPFVKVDGIFISYKSLSAEEELEKSMAAQKKLSCELEEKIIFNLQDTEYQRTYLLFRKKDKLIHKYPRQAGIPKKSPL